MVVIAVKETLLLVTMDGVIGGIEVENQFFRGLFLGGDKLLYQNLGYSDQRLPVHAVLETT